MAAVALSMGSVVFVDPVRDGLENRLQAIVMGLDARLESGKSGPITILAIDEEAVDVLGTWPWPRSVWAELIDRLRATHTPQLIAIDAVFPPTPDQPEGNTLFAAALGRQPAVVGQLMLHDDTLRGAAPWQTIGVAANAGFPPRAAVQFIGALGSEPGLVRAAHAGHINALVDADGAMRRVPTLLCDDGVPPACAPSFVQAMISALTSTREWSIRRGDWDEAEWMLVPARMDSLALPLDDSLALIVPWQTSGALRYASVARAWQGELAPGALDQRVVLIGGVSLGLGDYVLSPLYETVPGVEVHAHTLHAWLDGGLPYEPRYANPLMLAFAALTAAALLANLQRLRRLAAITVAGVVLPIIGATVAWRTADVWWPAAAPATFILFAGAILMLSEVLSERTRLRERFEAYLPAPLRRLIDKPDAEVPNETGWGTVMVADILGYTAQSHRLSMDQLAHWCGAGIDHVVNEAQSHGAMLDNVAGDGALLLWRTGTDVEQARSACEAAHAILEGLADVNAELAQSGLPPVAIGIGIHAGPYLLGSFGGEHKRYTVVSEVANLAAHIERETRRHPWPVLISRTVAKALPNKSTFVAGSMLGSDQRTMLLFTLANLPDVDWPGAKLS